MILFNKSLSLYNLSLSSSTSIIIIEIMNCSKSSLSLSKIIVWGIYKNSFSIVSSYDLFNNYIIIFRYIMKLFYLLNFNIIIYIIFLTKLLLSSKIKLLFFIWNFKYYLNSYQNKSQNAFLFQIKVDNKLQKLVLLTY